MIYDTLIVGGGMAGLTAGIYAARAGLNILIIEKGLIGGQIYDAAEIENYPGISMISGNEFSDVLKRQIQGLNIPMVYEEIQKIDLSGKIKTVNEYSGKTVIIATGAEHRKLGCEGEEKYIGKGVSYCASCDGHFFKGQTVCVIGGANSAVESAVYLAKTAKNVHLIHRRDSFTASRYLYQQLNNYANIQIHFNRTVTKICGEETVSGICMQSTENKETERLATNGVFIAIGQVPKNQLFAKWVDLSKEGYIISGEDCKTITPGVFVAGDTRTKKLRQLVTAASDGAIAAENCMQYLS